MFHVKHFAEKAEKPKGKHKEKPMQQWTEAQAEAIGSGSERIICSAAAGSGKTAVMIERVVRLIREGADPFSFLVITFTNAAAAEMKEKIRTRLQQEKRHPAVAAVLGKTAAMEVCTIHAFCQHLIRREFQAVGVDPSFGICSAAQADRLFHDAFRRACNQLKEEGNEAFLSFSREYAPAEAEKTVTAVYRFIMSLPDPFGWLRDKTEYVPLRYDPDHPWFVTAARMLREKVLSMQVILRRQADMFDAYEKLEEYRAVLKADMELVGRLSAWTEDRRENPEALPGGFVRLPAVKNLTPLEMDWRDRYRELRDRLKELYGEARALMDTDRERLGREFGRIRESLRGLAVLTECTHGFFERNKARCCVLDFADLEHKALAILRDESERKREQRRYRYVFVDECQDISTIQDALIRMLSGEDNTLFMVGDVKQSIYRFRQANPKLFSERISGGNAGGQQVCYLQENFRSRPEILETTNVVFRDIMRKEAAELEYTPADELKPGRADCPGREPVRVDLLEPGEGVSGTEAVAGHVAEEILRLVREGKTGYRDIVILMPEVSTDGPVLAKLLEERGIPVLFDGKGDYFRQPEIDTFRSLLALLENPHQDLALITVLMNAGFRFSEEEMSRIRIRRREPGKPFWEAFEEAAGESSPLGLKCRRAKEQLEKWRFQAEHRPLGDLLWFLMEDAFLSPLFGASEYGRTAQKNLRCFCLQGVRAAERGICTLRGFLDLLAEQAASGEMQSAPALGEEDQVVRIMTMHKSKGLQFPVVFCLGLNKGPGGKQDGTVEPDADLGICLPYKVAKWRLSRKTAADRIFRWKREHDTRAEKICLLYVAMTRAREKLYLVGIAKDRPLWHVPAGEHRVQAAEDYLDWIVPALLDDEKKSTTYTQGSKPWKIRVYEYNQQKTVETGTVFHNLSSWVNSVLSAPPVDDLWKTVPEEDGAGETENELKKYSVSTLLREARNGLRTEEEQTPEEKRTPEHLKRALDRFLPGGGPITLRAGKEADGAARGTAVHRFLSLADLDAVREAGGTGEALLARMLDRLVAEKVFTPEEAAWIDPEKITRFFASEVGQRMLASPEVHREWSFNLCLRDRGMMVQGMIDCAFREGEGWILLDYKTDRIRDEKAFVEEYRPQLAWYAVALRELTGLPVLESWLYALSTDKAYAVGM